MALTTIQREILRLLARERIAAGERYVARGVALGELLASPRISRDIDLFHDAAEAVMVSWEADRDRLIGAAYEVEPLRERPTFIEARVSRGGESVRLEWVQDSAFRFFPLIEHAEEIDALAFEGDRPDAVELSRCWHDALREAREIVEMLSPDEVGACVIDRGSELFRGDADALSTALREDTLRFHHGALRGAWPQVRG